MTFSWRKLVSSVALASQLLFSSPEASAKDPPLRAPPTIDKLVQDNSPSRERLKSSYFEVSPVYVDWNLFYINPQLLSPPKNSMLGQIDLDEFAVSTLGLSLDLLTHSTELGKGWHGDLPLGVFLDVSSSRLFDFFNKEHGFVIYDGVVIGYQTMTEMSYFALGLNFSPSAFYKNGPFSIGLTVDFKGGLTFFNSNTKIDLGLTDAAARAYALGLGISPDASGSIKIYGFGGFAQVLIGPRISLYDVICSGGAGLRYDGLTLRVNETIDNKLLAEGLLGNFKTEYNTGSIVFGAKCGYHFK